MHIRGGRNIPAVRRPVNKNYGATFSRILYSFLFFFYLCVPNYTFWTLASDVFSSSALRFFSFSLSADLCFNRLLCNTEVYGSFLGDCGRDCGQGLRQGLRQALRGKATGQEAERGQQCMPRSQA